MGWGSDRSQERPADREADRWEPNRMTDACADGEEGGSTIEISMVSRKCLDLGIHREGLLTGDGGYLHLSFLRCALNFLFAGPM